MTSDYILEVFRELHFAETDRHEKLNAQLSLPTAIVTVLCGVLSFYLDKYSAAPASGGAQTMFVVCLVLFFVAIVAAIIFLVLALFHYGYRALSDSTDIHDYMRSMEAWYIAIQVGDEEEIAKKVDRDVRELMAEQYVECAFTNRLMNSLKAKHIYFAKCAIIAALLMLALSVYPFYNSVKSVDKIHKVELVEKEK